MAQFYSHPERESDPHALPDGEVFYVGPKEAARNAAKIAASADCDDGFFVPTDAGWYYWFCFPGCLPDGDPIGPFESEAAAIEDARALAWDDSEYDPRDSDANGPMC